MAVCQIQAAVRLQKVGDHLRPSAACPAASRSRPRSRRRGRTRAARRWRPAHRRHPPRRSAPGPARPSSLASSRAASIAGAEKSRPTTSAPRCASVSVSMPKWHCRCSTRKPATGPSSASSMALSRPWPASSRSRDRTVCERNVDRHALVPVGAIEPAPVRRSAVEWLAMRAHQRVPPGLLRTSTSKPAALAAPPSPSGARGRASRSPPRAARALAGRSEKTRWW